MNGRQPLRALVLLLMGWICARAAVLLLWPTTSEGIAPVLARAPNASVIKTIEQQAFTPRSASSDTINIESVRKGASPKRFRPIEPGPLDRSARRWPLPAQSTSAGTVINGHSLPDIRAEAPIAPTKEQRPYIAPSSPRDRAIIQRRARFTGSFWALVGGKSGPGLGERATLGGSQIGMRVDRHLKGQVYLTSRVSAALGQPGKEITAGLSLSLKKLPVRFVVENRFALDRAGRTALSATASAGLYDHPLTFGLVADGYVQAGLVGAKRRDEFVDGALTVTRPAFGNEMTNVSAGLGLWGGHQPGADRLDIGPMVRIRHERISASIGWRQRIAGNASPGSGPVMTLGGNF